MGQTLNHGVYLPAEGERNCYSGLASNWNLLDAALGDIDGKASATHTHGSITNDGKVGTTANLPLITGTGGAVQTGSFGNQANTFCEGNDSRLSDARTPVAHTHTKSDVTDLLNSNFIPSANNFYDLGSSSYQWNKIYSADVVHTSGNETIAGNKKFSLAIELLNGRIYRDAASLTKGTLPSERTYYGITNDFALDSSDSSHRINQCRCWVETSGSNVMEWNLSAWNTTNLATLRLSVAADGSNKTYVIGATTIPEGNAVHDLGSSTYKWKSLNGINPGALSLPNLASDGYIDLSDNISANTEYSYTPTVDGWLALYCQTTGFHAENAVGIFTGGGQSNSYRWACSATSAINLPRAAKYHGAVMLPVKAGIPYLCWITVNSSTTLSTTRLYFYKATGNV